MNRAMSVTDMLRMKKKTYPFKGEWADAFGAPEQCGVWFIWGRSGSGKTSFTMKLCKELAKYGKVAYNSLEEGFSLTMKNALMKAGMQDVARKFILISERMEDLDARLKKRKSPDIVVIDSFQYTQMSLKEYMDFKARHRNKLLIFISCLLYTSPSPRDS